MEALPAQLEKIEGELGIFRRPIESVERATEHVEEMATAPDSAPAADEPVQVEVQGQSMTDIILTELQGFVILLILIVTLLYFLLASGDHFLQKLVKVQDSLSRKKLAVDIVRQIKSDVSTYLLAITVINCGLGFATGVAMYFLGMPNPLLWGVMAAILNYIPYLGALVGAAVIGLAAAAQFDSLGAILLVPAVFLILTTLEGYIVTPLILGVRLMLSPVVIFIGLIFWGWLWGVPGALIAVPVLVTMKIICDRIESLQPVGEFLGQ
jgi:predicted PurR-regulated permease PerM